MKRFLHLASAFAVAIVMAPLGGCQTEDEVNVDRPMSETNDDGITTPPAESTPSEPGLQNGNKDSINNEDVREVNP